MQSHTHRDLDTFVCFEVWTLIGFFVKLFFVGSGLVNWIFEGVLYGCWTKNNRTPKSSILIGFSIINHPYSHDFSNFRCHLSCVENHPPERSWDFESKQATAPLDAEETKKLEIFGMQKITEQNTGVCLNPKKTTVPPKLGSGEVEHFETSSHFFGGT